MGTWVEDMGLHAEGFTNEEIAEIDAAKDDILHIIATVRAIWPRLTRVLPVLQMVAERVAANQRAGQI